MNLFFLSFLNVDSPAERAKSSANPRPFKFILPLGHPIFMRKTPKHNINKEFP